MSDKFRQSYYYLTSIVSGVVGILLLFNGIKTGTADNITDILGGLGGLVGAGGGALAGKKVGGQIKDGTFEQTSAIDIVQAAIDAKAKVDSDLDAIKTAVSDAIGGAPILGPLAKEAIDNFKI